jgi:hypothetical protein
VLPLAHLLLDLEGLSAGQLFWPFLGADLSNVGIPGGLGATAGQPYADRVGDHIEAILGTYGEALPMAAPPMADSGRKHLDLPTS